MTSIENSEFTQTITLAALDNTVMRVVASSQSLYEELYNFLSFEVEGAKYNPRVRNKVWDGTIHLMDRSGKTWVGLKEQIERFAKELGGVQVVVHPFKDFNPWQTTEPNVAKMKRIVDEFKRITGWEPRIYQVKSWYRAIKNRRYTLVSPTGSGKSLIIYFILKYLCCDPSSKQTGIVIVPTTSLVLQMKADLIKYGYPEDQIQILKQGESKELFPTTSVLISTWQSLILQPKVFLNKFEVCICDEVHKAKSKSLIKIVSNMLNASVRVGMTGSLDDITANRMTIEGLFGPIVQYVTIEQLMAQGVLADLKVHTMVLQYPEKEKTAFRETQMDLNRLQKLSGVKKIKPVLYNNEIEYLIMHANRRAYIRELIGSMRGNTLVLFDRVSMDGVKLYKTMKQEYPDRQIYIVHGGIKAEEREEIRNTVINSNNALIIASTSTFSTGIDIPNLNNAISIAPTKSVIRVLQSIGRTLRVCKGKTSADWYDIVDDLSTGPFVNFALKHAMERKRIYDREHFVCETTMINVSTMKELPKLGELG